MRLQGGLYIFAGTVHFVVPHFYVKAMPPWLPFPEELHLVAGAVEIILGLGMLFAVTRKIAALLLALLMVSFLQVHVWVLMSQAPDFFVPDWVLWVRLPWQFFLIYWAWLGYKPAGLSTAKTYA